MKDVGILGMIRRAREEGQGNGHHTMGRYVVYRDEGNRWVVAPDIGAPPIGEWAPPRGQREAVDLLNRHLAAKGEAVISTQQGDDVLYVTTGPKREPVPYDITLRLSAMPEVARLLEGLSKEINKSAAETIIQALVILKIIVDAGKEGKRVAITDQDLNVEREILIPGQSHDLA